MNDIGDALVAVGGRYFEHSERLIANGFTSFLPYLDDDMATCSEAARKLHREYLVERAKESVGTWGALPITLLGPTVGYHSPFLTKLRAERERQGFDFTYYKNGGPEMWKCQLSPCLMERERISRTDMVLHHALLERTNAAKRVAQENERRLIATGILSRFTDESQPTQSADHWLRQKTLIIANARRLVREFLKKEMDKLGYGYAAKLSTATWFTFVHPFASAWQLRFIFSVSQNFLDVYLLYCHQSLPKQPTGSPFLLYDPEMHVEIRLKECSPYFHSAYYLHLHIDDWEMRTSLDRLEVNIRATLELYRMEHDYLIEVFNRQSREIVRS